MNTSARTPELPPPLADLVENLSRPPLSVQAQADPLNHRVTARDGARVVSVRLVARQWYHVAGKDSPELVPLHPQGMEFSVARYMARTLAGRGDA